jgi:tripartite-type tricarboxylate transporter receptor subunit TctC
MIVRRILLACLLLLSPSIADAQSWPTKPVRIVVSSGAGGTADIVARMIGERLTTAL